MLRVHHDNSIGGLPVNSPRSALEQARHCLESKLSENEDWRALRQLEAREHNGEWLDVIESDFLRDRLTVAVAAAPEFLAWQFVDAALGCLDASERAIAAPEPAAIPLMAIEVPAAVLIAAPDVAPAPPAAPPATNFLRLASPVHALPTADPPAPPEAPELLESLAAPPPETVALPAVARRALDLVQRIPTLQAHSAILESKIVPEPPHQASVAAPAELATWAVERALVAAVDDALSAAAAALDRGAGDGETTRFELAAAGIEEADVEIVVRKPASPLLEARLPPLLLTAPRSMAANLARPGGPPLPSESEVDIVHPAAFAIEEAQVAIIATGTQSDAEVRAERRALGVAPDRERHMHRFLRALAGD